LLSLAGLAQLLLQPLALRLERDGNLAALHRGLDVAAACAHCARRGGENLVLDFAQLAADFCGRVSSG
jgi:hypothetical protein